MKNIKKILPFVALSLFVVLHSGTASADISLNVLKLVSYYDNDFFPFNLDLSIGD
ncbi:hypothetical protein [Pseudomonas sp. RC10]|uniref:hypothetical protein n=1 Tax=Pseudomonas bambusae TaxID=3139142 RepID=UPI00313A4112